VSTPRVSPTPVRRLCALDHTEARLVREQASEAGECSDRRRRPAPGDGASWERLRRGVERASGTGEPVPAAWNGTQSHPTRRVAARTRHVSTRSEPAVHRSRAAGGCSPRTWRHECEHASVFSHQPVPLAARVAHMPESRRATGLRAADRRRLRRRTRTLHRRHDQPVAQPRRRRCHDSGRALRGCASYKTLLVRGRARRRSPTRARSSRLVRSVPNALMPIGVRRRR